MTRGLFVKNIVLAFLAGLALREACRWLWSVRHWADRRIESLRLDPFGPGAETRRAETVNRLRGGS